MKRLLAVAAAFVLLASACQKPQHAAAIVNGSRITDQQVVDELTAIRGNADYVQSIESGGTVKVQGAKDGSFDTGFVAQVLRLQIAYELVRQEVVRRNITIDGECRAAALQDTYATLSTTGNADDGKAVYDKFPAAYQQTLANRNAEFTALQASLVSQPCQAGDVAAAYFNAHPEAFAQSCLAVIFTDPAKAPDLYQQLQAGADFAALASANSTDAQSAGQGGSVGCLTAQEMPQEVAAAIASLQPGQVAPPVPASSGGTDFIVKLVERKAPSGLEEVRQQASELAANEANQAVNDWLTKALADAQISVDSRYGTWDPTTGSITPQTDPSSSSAPATDAPATTGP